MSDSSGISRLLDVVDRLRGANGCPWDRKQTLESLKPHLIEECYEVLDAVDDGDPDKHAEELGDVLLHIALHSRIRAEEGAFDFDAVAHRIADKLIRRHPHVFGTAQAADTAQVLANWEAIKATEHGGATPRSALAGVPRHLPALQRAQRIQTRAARVGFDWERAADVLAKVREETVECEAAQAAGDSAALEHELGDLLFAVVNMARFAGIDAEGALRKTADRFSRRFRHIEARVHAQGKTLAQCSLPELDGYWEEAKAAEHTPPGLA
jgi:tetrapyrrole methylase family protein / MazG family protein